jgi:hypothetical protein
LRFEQALQATLMLRGQQSDHGAGLAVVRVTAEGVRNAAHEARIDVAQHEAQLGGRLQLRVRDACVVERPLDQLSDEIGRERGEGRALCARQHHDDALAMREAIVE